jgi:hypothetical protein
MTSKQKVFSHSNDIMYYTEYIKDKNALTTLSSIKNNQVKLVKSYKNYDEFIKLSKIYSKFLICDSHEYDSNQNCTNTYTTDLYNANNSYVNNSSHINNKNINKYDYNECKALTNVLYPYGINLSNKKPNYMLTSKLYLDNWVPCNNPCIVPPITCDCLQMMSEHNNDNNNNTNNNNTKNNNTKNNNTKNNNNKNNNNKCKTGLCKNTRPLFV